MFSVQSLLALFTVVSLLTSRVTSDCAQSQCAPKTNPTLYPAAFSVFGAWNGRQYGSGETVLIIARFAASTCLLPEPGEAGPACLPMLSVGLRSSDGSTCQSILAANSTRQAEIDYGVKFNRDSNLDTGLPFNFWVFPLNVREGVYSSKLNIVGLTIPASCNIAGRVTFNSLDLIPKGNNLLSPNVSIDSLPPTIVNVYTGKPTGNYTFGDVINIIVEFSKAVYFSELPSKYGSAFMVANASYTIPTGLPFLELNSQAIALMEGYEAGSLDQRKLSFLYVVGTGEFTPQDGQLEVPAGSTIQLNRGMIAALDTGMEADLTSMPLPGTHGTANAFQKIAALRGNGWPDTAETLSLRQAR